MTLAEDMEARVRIGPAWMAQPIDDEIINGEDTNAFDAALISRYSRSIGVAGQIFSERLLGDLCQS